MTAPVTLMDTDEVRRLLTRVTEARDDFVEQVNAPPTYTPMSAAAFGTTSGGAQCRAAWEDLIGPVLRAATNLSTTLSADVRRLGEVIDAFERQDDLEADRIHSARGQLTVISSHAHNDSGNFPGEANDTLRAHQLDNLVNAASGSAGPVVVGSDDNVSLHEDEQTGNVSDPGYDERAPEALERYEDRGFESVGDVGGTLSGESIDHVHARGVEAGEATLVDGGPSDHDGQRVTYTVDNW